MGVISFSLPTLSANMRVRIHARAAPLICATVEQALWHRFSEGKLLFNFGCRLSAPPEF